MITKPQWRGWESIIIGIVILLFWYFFEKSVYLLVFAIFFLARGYLIVWDSPKRYFLLFLSITIPFSIALYSIKDSFTTNEVSTVVTLLSISLVLLFILILARKSQKGEKFSSLEEVKKKYFKFLE